MRINTLHNFAVKLQDKTKNAVRRRMLRSEIDVEVADVMFCHAACSGPDALSAKRMANSE
jgi:hypothetical protein